MRMQTDKKKKIILSLSWRDIRSPKAGGAEVYTHEFLKAVDKRRFSVIHISFEWEGCKKKELIDGVNYYRKGEYFSTILFARSLYQKNKEKIALVIDQCNTFRFFSSFWVDKKKRLFLIHQLTREIWFVQKRGILALVGYLTETPLLMMNRNDYTVTVSESTRRDLLRIGYRSERIKIIKNGLPEEIYETPMPGKDQITTFIYVGRYARYKGIDDVVEAFGKYRKSGRDARLWLVGKTDDEYVKKKIAPILEKYSLSSRRQENEAFSKDVEDVDVTIWGYVEEKKKFDLMQRAHALLCPSCREGWGIIISEAGYLGTPSIVYDSPGLRDAVNYGKAGFITKKKDANSLCKTMMESVDDLERYQLLSDAARLYAEDLRWKTNAGIIRQLLDEMTGLYYQTETGEGQS